MKKILIFTLFILFSLFSFSQNGGQFHENNVIRVEYLGYFNGNHTAKICNKQSCEVRIRTKAENDPAIDIQVPANSCVTITVSRPTSTAILFRAKSETSCPNFTNPDMGWVEINFINSVLNLVENNVIRIIRGPSTYNISFIGGVLKSDFGQFIERQTIIIYDKTGRQLFYHRDIVNKKYQIDLNQYFSKGVNFVRVFIENKFYDQHTFKFIKL